MKPPVKTYIIMILMLASTIMISTIPLAAAATPSASSDPIKPVVGGTSTITFTPDAAKTVVQKMRVGIFETPEGNQVIANPGFPASCAIPTLPGDTANNNIWTLTRGGLPVELLFSTQATVTFGSGLAPIVTVSGATSGISPAAGVFDWTDQNGVNGIQADNINRLASPAFPYTIKACGYDGPILATANNFFDLTDTFQTQVAVAGEILPINTTALLIAGFTTNPVWILSALAMVAGGALTLLRFQVSKRNI